METSQKCLGVTAEGNPCSRPPQASADGFCPAHRADPARGGRPKKLPTDLTNLTLSTHADCLAALERILQAMVSGYLPASRGTVLVSAVRAAQKSVDDVLTQRLERLEARLNLTPKG